MCAVNGHSQYSPREREQRYDRLALRLGVLMLSVIGAGQALLIIFLVAPGEHTDSFLGVYAIYAPLAAFGVSLRITAIPLVTGAGWAESKRLRRRFGRMGAGVASIALITLFAFPVAGDVTTSRLILVLLAPAAGFQIFAGGLSATLNAHGRQVTSMKVYVGSATFSLLVSASLLPIMGVLGAAVALFTGAIVVVVTQTLLVRSVESVGATPGQPTQVDRPKGMREIVAGASLALAQQLGLVLALRTLSESPGDPTIYSYAFYIVGVLLNVSVIPLTLMAIPALMEDLGRVGRVAVRNSLHLTLPAFSASLLPLLAIFMVFGEPIIEAVFQQALRGGQTELWSTAQALVGFTFGAGITALCGASLLAQRRESTVAALAAAGIVAYCAAFATVPGDGAPSDVAWRHSAATCLIALMCAMVVVRERIFALAGEVILRSVVVVGGSALAIGPFAIVVDGTHWLANVGAAAASLLLYGCLAMIGKRISHSRGMRRGQAHGPRTDRVD